MASNNIQENLKKYFYSGVGLAAHTAEVVQKGVSELVKKGKVSEADGKKLVADALKRVEAQRPTIEAKYNETVQKLVKATNAEIDRLQKKISKLEGQVTVKKAGASAPKKATAASAPKKVVAKAKKTAKKAVKKAATAAKAAAPKA